MFEAFVKAFLSAIWILGSFVSLYLWDASGLMKWTLGAIAWILLEIGTSWIDNSLLTMIWWVGLSPAYLDDICMSHTGGANVSKATEVSMANFIALSVRLGSKRSNHTL